MRVSRDDYYVEIAYAPSAQSGILMGVKVKPRTTIRGALEGSGIIEAFPELTLESISVGIWGERKDLAYSLQSGDRIEIYRPLQLDPKFARRRRILA